MNPDERPSEIFPAEAANRRDAIIGARVEATGIDEAMIRRLVHRFYGDIRADPVLGPIFAAKVGDWDAHLAKLCDFWSSIALMTGRFAGKPMQAHIGLPVEKAHFDLWLSLFRRAAADTCPPAAAAFFIERAERVAESLRLGIAVAAGQDYRTAG